ncbi:hypothetical protein ABPG72_008058 [Tetrahymena utriculariae]
MDQNFLAQFEKQVESDVQKLGGQLYELTQNFVDICNQKHPQQIDDYVQCRNQRDAFLRQELTNLSLRVKYVKYKTEECCDIKGYNGIVECSDLFKQKLNEQYLLTFKNLNNYN